MFRIFYKYLATGRPVTKTLIKYKGNRLEENDEEEKEPINIELTDQKHILIMMKMLLTWDVKIFQKSYWVIVWWSQYRT